MQGTTHLKSRGEVPVDVYKKVIDEVASKKVHVYITRRRTVSLRIAGSLCQLHQEKGLTVQIVTNGVGLERNAETIVDNGWDMICVSFDGPREIHDKCRGVPGAMDTAIKGLSTIQKIKKEKKKRKPSIFTLTTISSNNQYTLVDTVREAEKLNPTGI